MRKILLVGNPNVGKSVIFSRLTGVQVIASNYPGTTVGFTTGFLKWRGERIEVIDVPGVYSLEPTSAAEEVATDMLAAAVAAQDSIVINVIDATNLERNLNLTIQLLKKEIPVIVALNVWDETKHIGVTIDVGRLTGMLGVPVVPTVAVTGEGIQELLMSLGDARVGHFEFEDAERWHEIGKIVEQVQVVSHRHHRFLERLADLTIKPVTGLPIAILILSGTLMVVRLIGEGLIRFVLDPVFYKLYLPLISRVVALVPVPVIRALLVGTTPEVLQSFGLLTTGLYIPLVVVLPYLFSFYLVLSFLEDWGYLPRLAVLADTIFHRLGLHGYSAIPVMLGLGCKVPAVLATRILESRREKIIATALILMSAPCMPQTAMIVSILTPQGGKYLLLVFGILIAVAVLANVLLNKIFKGETPELFIEIPPYRIPKPAILFKKVWLRLSSFITDAIPMIILGIFFIGILDVLGVIRFASRVLGAPFSFVLGLPPQAVFAVLAGFLRKDVSIALLAPFHLSPPQLVIASVFLVLYLPCISTFLVMAKELGIRDALKLAALLLVSGLAVGGVLNLMFKIF
jgi:ferrous iron transport protein B